MSQRLYKYESLPTSSETGIQTPIETSRDDENYHNKSPGGGGFADGQSVRLLALASVVSSLLTLCGVWLFGDSSLENCGQRLSTYSPAFEAITYLSPAHFEATIVQTNRWRGELGHDPRKYDEAWKSIGSAVPGLRLDHDDLEKLGKLTGPEPGKPLHEIPGESGGGYPGQLEVFHLLHCLDWLRKGIFYNWEYYKDSPPYRDFSPRELEAHNDHCVDSLRMHLMCAADVTPVTYYDTPYRPQPFADFSTKHTCRNFDAILDWSKQSPRAISLDESYIGNSTVWNGTYPGGTALGGSRC